MHAARFTAVVVLPTPPFWFAIAYTAPIAASVASAPANRTGESRKMRVSASARALLRHPGAARQVGGGRAGLADQVQMPMLEPGPSANRLDPLGRHRELRRGAL